MKNYKVPEDRINIITVGYDDTILKEISEKSRIDDYEKKDGIIAYSGRISVYKGVFELVQAFEEVNKERPGWKLWLIGDGPDAQKLKSCVKRRGLSKEVAFLGNQTPEDAIRFTHKADIFAFPSYIESVPGSLLEAMALGKPSVVADVGPIGLDIVNEESGILVPPKDPNRLKEGIVRLIDNPALRDRMGSNARYSVRELTKHNMVKRTLEVYEKAVKRRD